MLLVDGLPDERREPPDRRISVQPTRGKILAAYDGTTRSSGQVISDLGYDVAALGPFQGQWEAARFRR